MPRNFKGTRRRNFDTRLTFKELCKLLRVTPLQRVKILKYIREVDNTDNENK